MSEKTSPTVVRRMRPVKTGYYGERAYRVTFVMSTGAHVRGFGRYKDTATAAAESAMEAWFATYYPEAPRP